MNPDTIIIHCSATRVDQNLSVAQIEQMHKERGFRKIGYHYYITKDGMVRSGRSEAEPGAHCIGYNQHSLGICYEGGLNASGKAEDTRTELQKASIELLLKQIISKYKIVSIIGHRDTSPDLNANGTIEPNEFIKQCPCFDARKEYKHLLIS